MQSFRARILEGEKSHHFRHSEEVLVFKERLKNLIVFSSRQIDMSLLPPRNPSVEDSLWMTYFITVVLSVAKYFSHFLIMVPYKIYF